MRVMSNKRGTTATVLITATETFAPSVLAVGGETIAGLHITQAWWGHADGAAGVFTVARGANTVLVLPQEGSVELAGMGMSMQLDPTANISVTMAGTGAGTLILQLKKVSDKVDAVGA